MKALLVTILLLIAGDWIAKKFVMKNADTGSGFVEVTPGFGLDDVAYFGTLGLTVFLGKRMLRKWVS